MSIRDERPSKAAEIMAAREAEVLDFALAEGESLGLRTAWLACYRIYEALNTLDPERANGARGCVVAIEKLIKEAEPGRIEEDDAEPKEPHGLVNQDSASEVPALTGHGRVVCVCGKVISQCRCPGPHKTVTVSPCTHRQEAGR